MAGQGIEVSGEETQDANDSDNDSSTGGDNWGSTMTTQWDRTKIVPRPYQIQSISEQNALGRGVKRWRKFVGAVFFLIATSTGVLSRLLFLVNVFYLRPKHVNWRSQSFKKGYEIDMNYIFSLTDEHKRASQTATDVNWVWACLMVLIAPFTFQLLSCLKSSLFKDSVRVSTLQAFVRFLLESVHVVALCALVFAVLPRHDPMLACLMLSSTVSIPALLSVRQPCARGTGSRKSVFTTLDFLSFLVQVGTVSAWTYKEYDVSKSLAASAMTFFSLTFVSIRNFRNYLPGSARDSNSENQERQKLASGWQEANLKLAIHVWKILATIGLAAIYFSGLNEDCFQVFFLLKNTAQNCSLVDEVDLNNLSPSLDGTNCVSSLPYLMAIVNIFASVLCQKVLKSSCKVMLQRVCFALPLCLMTPLTFGFLCVSYVSSENIQSALGCLYSWPYHNTEDTLWQHLSKLTTGHWLPLGVGGYLTLLFVTRHIWLKDVYRFASKQQLFTNHSYCGALLESSLMTDRARKQKTSAKGDNQSSDKDEVPKIYSCATLWHENYTEMKQLLKSLLRLDQYQYKRQFAMKMDGARIKDYFDLEMHIFMDNAFNAPKHRSDRSYTVNEYVKQLVKVVNRAASSLYNCRIDLQPIKMSTPYGGRLVWRLPGGHLLTVHLKDKEKIRIKKRWSQIMYMYYLLGYKLGIPTVDPDRQSPSKRQRKTKHTDASNTFLLVLDGDVDFQPEAVQVLVDRLKSDKKIGAACGRIHPMGNGVMMWYQKFEYAVSHWLQKATENVLGTVLCCPGCFSLFRGSALLDDNVMRKYATKAKEPRHYVQYDQGEDRWLCTLLIKQGYAIAYCAASDSYTFAPEHFGEYAVQRRRWIPSTMGNLLDLLMDWKHITKRNDDINALYMMYQMSLFLSSFITPATIFILVIGSINAAYPSFSLWLSFIINIVPLLIFIFLCFVARKDTQIGFAAVLSLIYFLVMIVVAAVMLQQMVVQGLCSFSVMCLVFIVFVFLVTAILHPKEFTTLFYGVFYFLCFPSSSMLLLIYSLTNMHEISWGTRESNVITTEVTKKEKKRRGLICEWGIRLFCPPPPDESLSESMTIPARAEHQGVSPATRSSPRINSWLDDVAIGGRVNQLDKDETLFWNQLIHQYLRPIVDKPGERQKINQSLIELRNKVCAAYLVINAVFVILVFTLQSMSKSRSGLSLKMPCSEDVEVEAINPISAMFILVFGILLLIQFLAMLFHRYSTLLHVIAAAERSDLPRNNNISRWIIPLSDKYVGNFIVPMQDDGTEKSPCLLKKMFLIELRKQMKKKKWSPTLVKENLFPNYSGNVSALCVKARQMKREYEEFCKKYVADLEKKQRHSVGHDRRMESLFQPDEASLLEEELHERRISRDHNFVLNKRLPHPVYYDSPPGYKTSSTTNYLSDGALDRNRSPSYMNGRDRAYRPMDGQVPAYMNGRDRAYRPMDGHVPAYMNGRDRAYRPMDWGDEEFNGF